MKKSCPFPKYNPKCGLMLSERWAFYLVYGNNLKTDIIIRKINLGLAAYEVLVNICLDDLKIPKTEVEHSL